MTITPSPENPLYSVRAVAKIFAVQESTVRRWIREKEMAAIKVKGRWRVEHEEVVRVVNREHG